MTLLTLKLSPKEVRDFDKNASHPLQSYEWGEFRKAWGNKLVRFSFGQITVHKLPLLPLFVANFSKGNVLTSKEVAEIYQYALQNRIVFIKFEPNIVQCSEGNKFVNLLVKNGARKGKTLFTPSTFHVDLTKSEDELLKSFHSKTRYNIRLAQRKGVEVVEDNSNDAFERYLFLTKETALRQGFYAHDEKYHRLMWKYLHSDLVSEGKKPIAHLLCAKYKNKILASWILFSFKDALYYPYGASSNEHRELMAPNLLMWEAIRFGKLLGLKRFDLWGKEEGKGFTRFKEGYSPKVVEFIGTYDLVINGLLYRIFTTADILRWKLLRLKARLKK